MQHEYIPTTPESKVTHTPTKVPDAPRKSSVVHIHGILYPDSPSIRRKPVNRRLRMEDEDDELAIAMLIAQMSHIGGGQIDRFVSAGLGIDGMRVQKVHRRIAYDNQSLDRRE